MGFCFVGNTAHRPKLCQASGRHKKGVTRKSTKYKKGDRSMHNVKLQDFNVRQLVKGEKHLAVSRSQLWIAVASRGKKAIGQTKDKWCTYAQMFLLAYVIFKSNMIANLCFRIWQARIHLLRQQEVEVLWDVWLRVRVCSHAVSPHRIGFGAMRMHSKRDRCHEVNMNKSTSHSHTRIHVSVHAHMWMGTQSG